MATNKLEERVLEKVKEQLGDLMTAEEMKPLVEKAINEAFFTTRKSHNGYGHLVGEKPPIFVELIEKEMQNLVKAQVEDWFKNNPTVVADAIEKVIAKGIFNLVMNELEIKLNQPLYEFANRLRNAGI